MVLAWKPLHAQVKILRVANPCQCSPEVRPHQLYSRRARALVLRNQSDSDFLGSASTGPSPTPAVPTMGPQKPTIPVDTSIAKNLLAYINASWTPYHAVGRPQCLYHCDIILL